MLCASRLTYFIDVHTNQLPELTEQDKSDYYDVTKWKGKPKAIVRATNAALVGEIEEGAVVAFRGTLCDFGSDLLKDRESIEDIIVDMCARLTKAPNIKGEIHHGFLKAVESIYAPIIEALKSINRKKVFITGHSKGGAMAPVFGALLKAKGDDSEFKPEPIITFAAPRVGDPEFISSYPYEVMSFQYKYDIIPYLPPFGPLSEGIITILKMFMKGEKLRVIERLDKDFVYGLYKHLYIIGADDKTINVIETKTFFSKVKEILNEVSAVFHIEHMSKWHSIDKGSGYYDSPYSSVSKVEIN